MLDPNLAALAAALRERLALIADEESRRDPSAHIRRLQQISEKIDAIYASLRRPIDPELAHFISRRSYSKALAYLDGNVTSGFADDYRE